MYPTLIEIHGFEISTFGVMMAVAFLVGGWMTARAFEDVRFGRDAAWHLVTWAMVGGVAGSKLWFAAEAVARNPGLPLFEPLFSRAGITWYGGLLGGVVLVLAAAWRGALPLVGVMNAAAPALAMGQALGRVGCFLVGDDYGGPTDLPWGIAFPDGVDPTTERVHPTQLYEVIWLGLGALLLWRRRDRSPCLFAEYLILQGVGRLWIELYRTNPPLVGPLSNAQVAAIACLVFGGIWWTRSLLRRSRELRDTPA